jgi:hypothetical protein
MPKYVLRIFNVPGVTRVESAERTSMNTRDPLTVYGNREAAKMIDEGQVGVAAIGVG